jgi:hypothetical protein
MLAIPSIDGLGWSKVRAVAKEVAATGDTDAIVEAALVELHSPDARRRMLGTYLLGFTSTVRLANLELLRAQVVPDPSWEVQEALAQGFDAFCAGVGYNVALPTIDRWLADAHPNARRAVTEGLRPWTSKSRPYFARHPTEAIRRLAALRGDPSEYVRHSVGNALRDIRRSYPDLVVAETSAWNLEDAREAFTYARVLKAH